MDYARIAGEVVAVFNPSSAMYFADDRVRTKDQIPELNLPAGAEGTVVMVIKGPPGYGDRQLAVLFKGVGRPMMVTVDEIELAEETPGRRAELHAGGE